MKIIKIEENTRRIISFSHIIDNCIKNHDYLFDTIESLNSETKIKLHNQYAGSEGPINKLRSEIASTLKEGSLNRDTIIQKFDVEKKKHSKKFSPFKDLFSITYPFVIFELKSTISDTLKALAKSLIRDLGLTDKTSSNVVGFGGPRNTGSNHAWIALYNQSHPNQESAIQMFLSIQNGKIWYAIYDRANDYFIDNGHKKTAIDFRYEELLSFYQEHINLVLNNNYIGVAPRKTNGKRIYDNDENLFLNWLQDTHPNITRPEKYVNTIGTISNDLQRDIKNISLFSINSTQKLKEIYSAYFDLEEVVTKNTKGNRMYSRAFDLYIEYREDDSENSYNQIADIINNDWKGEGGEKETLILARLGQGKFRKNLLRKWKGCAISSYPHAELLVASHIKPWSKCDNREKVDPYNGLLLLPTYDKLFDKGFISFTDNGNIIISQHLVDIKFFGIDNSIKIKLGEENKKYMAYHRDHVLKK